MANNFYMGMILMAVIIAVVAIITPQSDANIPPTNAVQKIEVQTNTTADQNTFVNTTTYNDIIHFVSDGSITFNVTDSP